MANWFGQSPMWAALLLVVLCARSLIPAQPSADSATFVVEPIHRASPLQLAPASDDRPFFNHQTRWSAIDSSVLRSMFTDKPMGFMFLGPVAEISLLVLLGQSIVITAILCSRCPADRGSC